MNEADVAWAAGFFEGEGSFGASKNGKYLMLQIKQNDREPLDKMVGIVGGKVYGPYSRGARLGANDFFVWSLNGKRAKEVAELLRPHLSLRRLEQLEARTN